MQREPNFQNLREGGSFFGFRGNKIYGEENSRLHSEK